MKEARVRQGRGRVAETRRKFATAADNEVSVRLARQSHPPTEFAMLRDGERQRKEFAGRRES
jgi:hypothetical protein